MMNVISKKPIYLFLIGFTIFQSFLVYYYPGFRHDEIQYILGLDKLKWTVFFSPGFDQLLTGGQSFTHLIFYIFIKIFGYSIWLKFIPILFINFAIYFTYKSLNELTFKNTYYFLIVLILNPSLIFISTDFKQYSMDLFFMSIVFYVYTNNRTHKYIKGFIALTLYFFSLPASIFFCMLNFYQFLQNYKSNKVYFNFLLFFMGAIYYQTQFSKNNPQYFTFMQEHWAAYNRALGPYHPSFTLVLKDLYLKIHSIFYTISTSKSALINTFFFLLPFTLIKSHLKLLMVYCITLIILTFLSIAGYYPIPNFNADLIPNLIDYRTTYFLIPLYFYLLFLCINKLMEKKKIKIFLYLIIISFIFISPNHLKTYFFTFKQEEGSFFQSIVLKHGKVANLVVTDWEINLFQFYKIKNNLNYNIINEYTYLNNPEKFLPNDQIFFILNKKDPNLNRFKADNRLRQVDENIQSLIFDMPPLN